MTSFAENSSNLHETQLTKAQVKDLMQVSITDKNTGKELKVYSPDLAEVQTDSITSSSEEVAYIDVKNAKMIYDDRTGETTVGGELFLSIVTKGAIDATTDSIAKKGEYFSGRGIVPKALFATKKGSVVDDGITVSAYITYTKRTVNGVIQVSMTKVNGAFTNVGSYYYTSPHVAYANSLDYDHQLKDYPPATWSYNTDSAYIAYQSNWGPYVDAWCNCQISGMSPYEVECLYRLNP